MITLRRVFLIAIVTLVSVGSGGHLGALPGSEVDILYYDQNFNVIGEHAIVCSGGHLVWGEQSGAFRSIDSDSCNSGGNFSGCSYFSSTNLWWVDYSCDDPPPCGFDVTCP